MFSTVSTKLAFIALMITSFSAFAVNIAPLEQISGTVDAGVVQQRLEKKIVPSLKPGGAPIQETPHKTPEMAAAEKIHFKLTKVIFSGNTIFSNAELQTIFQPSINKSISLADFQNLVSDITKKYRAAGYILSRAIIPPQTVKNGAVKVQIIEGFISQVVIIGDAGITQSLIARYGDSIKQMHPLQFKKLERDMLLMNDLPGITVKSVISPSKNVPGGADLALYVQRKAVGAYASYDNYGTRYLGPQESGWGLSGNSIMFAGDTNSLRYVTTAQTNQLKFYEFDHSNPIGVDGLNLALGTNYSNTEPAFVLTPLDIIGRSFSLYTDLSYAVMRSRSENILLHAGFNYQNVTSKILGELFYADRMRSLIIGGKYNSFDDWHGVNNVSLDLSHGFDILGAKFHPSTQSRPMGLPNYTKVNLNFSRLQELSSRFSLLAGFQTQYALNPELATIQYAYGGSDFGRGYDPAEIIGDSALAGKLEFRMDTAPGFRLLQTVQYFAFYDGGVIWNRDSTDLPDKQSAFSTGVGARFSFIPEVSGTFYIARPLTRPVATIKLMGKNGNMVRTFFQIVANI